MKTKKENTHATSIGSRTYTIEFRDDEGDMYEREFYQKTEALMFKRELKEDNCKVTETWIHDDERFIGRF